MTFDIVDITQEEVDLLSTIQKKLMRTAQQKKNELYRKLQKQLAELKIMVCSNGVKGSTIYAQSAAQLEAEYNTEVDILREQLEFNMSLKEPTTGDETGGGETDNTGYIVDYELNYLERYIIVRDYYLAIEDPNERLALYQADEVAKKYLGTYYNSLFDYLVSLT